MKFRKLKSNKEIDVKISDYAINWNKKSCSSYQTRVKKFLEPYWKGHQVLEEFRIPGSLLRIDIINLNRHIVIEVDGEFHNDFSQFAHKTRSNWRRQMKRDTEKREWAEENGYTFIQIFPEDLDKLSSKWFMDTYGIILV